MNNSTTVNNNSTTLETLCRYRRDTEMKRCRSQLLYERKYYDIILKNTYLKEV